jgi:hypothetical protein
VRRDAADHASDFLQKSADISENHDKSAPRQIGTTRPTLALAVYGEPAVTVALMRDGKIFDTYDGNCFSQACGVVESDLRADD